MVAIGTVFSLVFHVGTKEEARSQQLSAPSIGHAQEEYTGTPASGTLDDTVHNGVTVYGKPVEVKVRAMQWTCWLREPQFYQVGITECQECTYMV